MIKSMTGFGKTQFELEDKKFTIELRSLNSKQLDINLKIPAVYRDKETILRNEIALQLSRGKVDLIMYIDHTGADHITGINTIVVKHYFEQLQKTGNELGMNECDPMEIMKIALRMPDTLINNRPEPNENEWELIWNGFLTTLDNLNKYRIQEGNAMQADIAARIENIEEFLNSISQFENSRIQNIRIRLQKNLKEFYNNNSVDRNRFEQEIIFYLEKLDITEEKVRLKSHLDYLRESLQGEEQGGKKLVFISQEIGREINTIGSKANDFNIQKLVVQMKDELEKIKEQSLNIL